MGEGGFPCMRTPTRKILEAVHTKPNTLSRPMIAPRVVCQVGMGSVDAASRMIIANGCIGGRNEQTTATVPFGFSLIGIHSKNGIIKMIITGPIRVWASRKSLTALPTAAMIEAIVK